MIKFKVKRSDWFEGLLRAEELIKDGFLPVIPKPEDNYVWFSNGRHNTQGVSIYDKRLDGYNDYLEHYIANKDIINKP